MPQIHAINQLASTIFLIERLQAPALAQLVMVLHREVPSAWAFTGSVAMNIHAANARGRKIRDFRDADVQIDDTAIASFEQRQLYRGDDALFTRPPTAEGGDGHYDFNGMSIDFVKNKRGTPRCLSEREMIAGIPVLSLAALRERKEADCNQWFDPARAEKARRDLPLLDDLIESSQGAPAARTAAASNSAPAGQGAKRKRENEAEPH